MSSNKEWCRSLDEWKDKANTWANNFCCDEKDTMNMGIFIDFRHIYGSTELSRSLKEYVANTFKQNSKPQYSLAKLLLSKDSLFTLFGRIKTTQGTNKEKLVNIKYRGIQVVECARIFSLRYGIQETNTLARIDRILEESSFDADFKDELREIKKAYEHLIRLRIQDAYNKHKQGKTADNKINIQQLDLHDLALLKQSLLLTSRIPSIINHYYPYARYGDRYL